MRAVITLCCTLLLTLITPCLSDDILHVHIIPHSHCDPGWLNTFDGYYNSEVATILNNVLKAVSKNQSRRFVWSEISFFHKWYEQLALESKQQFQKLVHNHQIEFVNGGWVQNDEASPDYLSVINQLTVGHEYLLHNFGVKPVIAWQIDPFGHSSSTPSLSALAGFEALVINRIHHSLKDVFKDRKTMEFIWRGADVGERTELLTHVLHTHYSAPQGYDWEEGAMGIETGNVEWRANDLVNTLKHRAQAFRTNHLLVPFGDDFKFKQADRQFDNMDRLMQHINSHRNQYKVDIKYSTLHEYFFSIQHKAEFPVFRGDFFPYADNEDSYWVGYYITRPALKQGSRNLLSLLRAAESLHVLVRSSPHSNYDTTQQHLPASYWESKFRDIDRARQEAALFLHHDAITGTSRSNVVGDYIQRAHESSAQLLNVMARMIEHLLTREPHPAPDLTPDAQTFEAPADGEGVYHPVVFYNSLAWVRTDVASIKVVSRHVRVYDEHHHTIPCQVDFIWQSLDQTNPSSAAFMVHFIVEIPPLGAATYYVWLGAGQASAEEAEQHKVHHTQLSLHSRVMTNNNDRMASKYITYSTHEEEMSIENNFLKFTFNGHTGQLDSVTNKASSSHMRLQQRYGHYSTSRSGAYIFRPHGPVGDLGETSPVVRVMKGPIIHTVLVRVNNFDVMYRLVQHTNPIIAKHIEITQGLGVEVNKELVCTFRTDISNDRVFYTHTGLEFMRRKRKDHTIPANFYPMIAGARIMNDKHRLTIYTPHAMACGSQEDGSLQLMMHRSLGQDDGRGLGEGVNDHSKVIITLWMEYDMDDGHSDFMIRSTHLNHPTRVFYKTPSAQHTDHVNTPSDWHATQYVSFSGLKAPLPAHVHLLSLLARDSITDDIVLRFHNLASPPASTDNVWPIGFSSLFSSEFEVSEVRQVTASLHTTIGANGYERSMSFKHESTQDTAAQADAAHNDHQVRPRSLGTRVAVSQNSEEEGVFVSQAALDRMKKDREAAAAAAGGGGRRRLLGQEQCVNAAHGMHRRLLFIDQSPAMEALSPLSSAADMIVQHAQAKHELEAMAVEEEWRLQIQQQQQPAQAPAQSSAGSNGNAASRHLLASELDSLFLGPGQIHSFIVRLVSLEEDKEWQAKGASEAGITPIITNNVSPSDNAGVDTPSTHTNASSPPIKPKLPDRPPDLPIDIDINDDGDKMLGLNLPQSSHHIGWNVPSQSEYFVVFLSSLLVVAFVMQSIRWCMTKWQQRDANGQGMAVLLKSSLKYQQQRNH